MILSPRDKQITNVFGSDTIRIPRANKMKIVEVLLLTIIT